MLCLGGALCGAALGCAHSAEREAAAPFSAPATQSTAAKPNVDQQVIEAALSDLLALSDSPVAVRNAPPAELRFAANASTYPVKAQQVLMRHQKERWEALSTEQVNAATEAANDLVRRHEAKQTFAPFTPSDPRVKVETQPRPTTIGSIYERPIRAWSPGYTRGGRYAIVFLSIPWSMHHADGTYLLERDGDGWKVLLRQFVYYV
jgi:hypothetical protein